MKTPTHIAIIMDGNRRWARKHKLEILRGHQYAADNVLEKIVEHAAKVGVKYLTFWAFSTENWSRDKFEVEGLMNILRNSLKTKIKSFLEKGVRLKVIGDTSVLSKDLQTGINKAIELTKNGKAITVIMAINYGGRDEIVRAVSKMYQGSNVLKYQGVEKEEIQKEIEKKLDTKDMPNPDLIIRTGGEQRLSGFLLWQSEYSELYFTDTLWPDFSSKNLDTAIEDFTKRQRRFGK